MKFRTTRKEMLNRCACQCVPYETLDNLLRFTAPNAYTEGTYGWNADVYVEPNGRCAIVTGYRPFGAIYFTPDELKAWDERAKEAVEVYGCGDSGKSYVNDLLTEFFEEFIDRLDK